MGNALTPLAPRATRSALGLGALCGLAALGAGVAGGSTASAAPTLGVVTTAHVTFDLKVALPGRYVNELRGSGLIDFTHHAVSVTVRVPATGLHSNEKTKNATTKSTTATSNAPIVLKVKWVGGAAYLSVPSSLAALAGGSTVTYPVNATETGDITTSIGQTAVAVSYTRILMDTLIGQHPRAVGTRTIDGVRASGTSMDLTLSQLLKVVPAMGPLVENGVTSLVKGALSVTAWVDRHGRLVQATLAPPKAGQAGLSGSVSFTRFNAPVSITAPPAASVKPISKSALALLQAENPFASGG